MHAREMLSEAWAPLKMLGITLNFGNSQLTTTQRCECRFCLGVGVGVGFMDDGLFSRRVNVQLGF